MAEKIEQILSNLLVPDNSVIQQATQELKEVIKDPAIVPTLCTVLASSQSPQVRQYAAVLLRRKILKKVAWASLSADVAQNIKQNVLQVLLQEPEQTVRKSLAQLIATVAKHDLPEPGWGELFSFLQQFTHSDDPQQRQVGMFVLSTVASSAAEQLMPFLSSLLDLCNRGLQDAANHMIPYYSIQTLTHLVPVIGSEQSKVVQNMLPQVVQVIQALVPIDEDLAMEALEILDELVDTEVSVIVPHIRSILEFCLQLGANKELGGKLRIKALSFVSWITRLKKKTVLKFKLVEPILCVLFPILCEATEEGEDDEDFEEAETEYPPTYATQVIDVLALHLPPEKIIPPLMKHIEASLQHNDPHHRKAGYLAMAVAAEGCADHMRLKYLQTLLQTVYKGLGDNSPVVRNAAMFALGQFSEHLQPDISKFSEELLPILFECLGKASADVTKDPHGITKTYYALEVFCENLEKGILPYLPQLMQYLLCTLRSDTVPHVKELAISAIGAAANAAEEDIVVYFEEIITCLRGFLTATEDEAQLKVQVQSLDTLGVLARNLKEHFRPLGTESLQVALQLMSSATDPDLRRSCYGLLGALSTLMKTEMAPHMETAVTHMISSVKSTEGITAHYNEEESQIFQLFEDDEVENIEGSDDEDGAVEGFSVENAYLDEKEDACHALGELAENLGEVFLPFMEQCHKEVLHSMEYPATNVRKGAVIALGKFCCSLGKQLPATQTALNNILSVTIPKILTMIREDDDRLVVSTALDSLNEVIKEIGLPVLQCLASPEVILALVKDIMMEKVACQDAGVEDAAAGDAGDDDQQAEYDTILRENAGELIPTLARVMGGTTFSPYFSAFLPDLLKKMKKNNTVAEKSFAVGTIGETLLALQQETANFAPTLYPVLMSMMSDEDEEVRSNSVFSVGVLMAYGGANIKQHIGEALKTLFALLEKEGDRRVVDNICAAVCRMIDQHGDAVPVTQVLPLVMGCLPLVEDQEENETVYPCILRVYQAQPDLIIPHLPQLLKAIASVINTKHIQPETKVNLTAFIRDLTQKQGNALQDILSTFSQEQVDQLKCGLS